MKTMWTIETLSKRVLEISEGVISLAPNQIYKGAKYKMKFIDKDYGEWDAYVCNILKGQGHKLRGPEKCFKKHGYRSPLENPEIREKTKQTYFKKHGVDNPFKNPEEQKKGVETRLKRYGVKHAQQSPEIKKKTAETCKERYGVEKFLSSREIREQIKATCRERYGGNAPICGFEILNKVKETNLKEYNVDNPAKAKKIKHKIVMIKKERYGYDYIILPNGMTLPEYIKEYNLDLTYDSCKHVYKKYGREALLEYLEHPEKFKRWTSLERMASILLDITPFQKFLKQIRRKPDFKITDKLYFDIDGLYWHSKNKYDYHFIKRQDYENKGLRLIQIRENEFAKNKQAVKSLIDRILNVNITTLAVNKILEINKEESYKFQNENHFLEESEDRALGIFNNNELIMLVTYKIENSTIFLTRVCTKLGIVVKDGLSILVQNLCSLCNINTIIVTCDLRYDTGLDFEQAGFVSIKEELDWCWTDCINTFRKEEIPKNNWRFLYGAGIRTYKLEIKEKGIENSTPLEEND